MWHGALPQDRDSCAGVWPYKSYIENALFLLSYLNVFHYLQDTRAHCFRWYVPGFGYNVLCAFLIIMNYISTSLKTQKSSLSNLTHSGDLLLWVGICRAMCIMLFLKNCWANLDWIWYVVFVRYKILLISGPPSLPLTPRGDNSGVKSLKFMYFFEKNLLYSGS